MRKIELLFAAIFILCFMLFGYYETRIKLVSPTEQFRNQTAQNKVITGTLQILWDVPMPITSPVSLVSNVPFDLELAIDIKLVNENETLYFYDIPFQQTLNLVSPDLTGDGIIDINDLTIIKNEFGLTGDLNSDITKDGLVDIFDVVLLASHYGEPGSGLFGTLIYTIPITTVSQLTYKEWIRPRWDVISQTTDVYLEPTNEVFTSSSITPIWNWLTINNVQRYSDNEGFFYNQIIQIDWTHRVYLPVIVKGNGW